MSARRLRVLELITSLGQGGAEQVVFDIVTGLDPARFEVQTLALMDGGPYIERLRSLGHPVESLGVRRKLAPGAFVALAAALRRHRPDVIHAHLFHADVAARVASCLSAAGRRAAFVSHQHIPDPRSLALRRRLERWTRRRVQAFVCVSESVAAAVRAGGGAPAERLRVIANGRELAPFLALDPQDPRRRAAARAAFGLPEDRAVVGCVGRLAEQKDHALLLEAFARLPGEPMLALAGEGPLRSALEGQARALGLGERMVFLGRREDVPRLLEALDVFVMSSLYEGLPIALIEAMAAGLAVVAVAAPGVEDAAAPGCQRLVASREPAALTAALEAVLAEPEQRRTLGAAARASAAARFTRARMVGELAALFEELCAAEGAFP